MDCPQPHAEPAPKPSNEKEDAKAEQMKANHVKMEEMGEPKVEQGTQLEREISVISEDLLNVSTDVLEVLDSSEEDDWPLTERAPSHRTPEGKEKKSKVRDSLSMQEQLTYDREVYKERA